MERVHLDFVRTPRHGRHAWVLPAIAAIGLAGLVAWTDSDLQPRLAAAEVRLSEQQARLDALRPTGSKLEDKDLAGEWSRAMKVAAELNLPWDKLFTTFEANADKPVALLTLEPNAAKREVILTAEAKNFEEMLAFYRRLQQENIFASVALHTHQINQQDRDRPVRFRITAAWTGTP